MLSSKLPIFRCSSHVSATTSFFLSGLSSSVVLMSTNSFSTTSRRNNSNSSSFINSNAAIRHHFNNNQQQQMSPRMISTSIFRSTRTLLSSDSNNSNNSSSAFDEEPKKQDNFAVPSWTNPNARNLYTRLGLRSNASTLDIKKHYRHLAKLYHPDSNSGDKEAEEKFRKVKEAYETLSNTDKRKVYDATGASGSEQEQAGFGGGQASYRQYQWSGSGLHGKYNIRFDENGRPIFEVPRWIWFIMFFSVGMFISAFRELRSRKHNKEIPNDLSREHELGVQRSSLWRPFIAMMLFMSFLPRLPACICCWWFYVYRPTIQAEDRATMDNITIIMNDQFNGTAVNMTLASPFLELAQKKWNAKTKDAEEYIMTVTLRPTISTSLNQQVVNSNNDSSQEENNNNNNNNNNDQSQQQQQQIAPAAVEYPNGQTNHFQMSFPRPRSADGKTILPCTATVRVKQVVRGKDQKLDLESSKTIFERQLTIV